MLVRGIKNGKEVVSGIYKITSPDGRVYIGQSNNILRRIYNERCYGYCKDELIELRKAMKQFGKDNFIYEVVEIVEDENERNEREIFYISMYDSTNPDKGFNTESGGKPKTVYSEELKKHLSEIKKGKPSNNKGKYKYFEVVD